MRHALLLASVLSVPLSGCASLLGFDDTELRPAGDGGPGGGGADADPNVLGVELGTLAPVRVVRGESAELEIGVARNGGLTGEITVTVDLVGVTGVTADPLVLADGESIGSITLTAVGGADPLAAGVRDVMVSATAGGLSDTGTANLTVADLPGVLDSSLAGGGVVTSNLLTTVKRVVLGPSGEIFVAGANASEARVVALDPDGAVVTSFGGAGTGYAVIPFPIGDIALRPDGGILVTGQNAGGDLVLRALSSVGTVDGGFGNLGEVVFTPAEYSTSAGQAIVVDTDGSFYVAGVAPSPTTRAWRFQANGTRDDAVDLPLMQSAHGLAIQSTGRIVVLGRGQSGNVQPIVTGLTWSSSNLAIDTSFGSSGSANFDEVPATPYRIAVGAGDVIAVAAQEDIGNLNAVGLMTASGTETFWEESFFNVGSSSHTYGVAVDASGKPIGVTYGEANAGQYKSAAVFRLDGSGNLDNAFSGDGVVLFDGADDSAPDFRLDDVAIDSAGRVVAAGLRDGTLLVVRLWN